MMKLLNLKKRDLPQNNQKKFNTTMKMFKKPLKNKMDMLKKAINNLLNITMNLLKLLQKKPPMPNLLKMFLLNN